MNLIKQLESLAIAKPERVALIENGRTISYGSLYAEVCNGSNFLQAKGLKKGDCILILQPISIELYITLLSVLHAGMTVMFIDPSAGNKMIRHSLNLRQPDGFIGITKAHFLRITIPEIRRIKKKFHTTGLVPLSKKWKPTKAKKLAPAVVEDDTPALITFTSGSTGMPKAACRSHGFLIAQHEALSESLEFREDEVDLITLPIFAIANLASGMTSVIADTDLRFPAQADSAAILNQCIEHGVTRCAASPAFFQKLFSDGSLPAFKTIYTGGAPVFPHLIDTMQKAYPELNIVTVYGSTEAEPIAHIGWGEVRKLDHEAMKHGKGLLVGKPVSATQVMICDENASNKIGQITVTGDHVLKGYLNGIGDEESKFKLDGKTWHLTGDMGYIDDYGRLWLMGRESAVFEMEGEMVYPFGIECAVMHHSSVERCAVILLNEKPLLCLQLIDESLENVKSDFPEYQFLECICLKTIPMDKRHNAKVDYPALIEAIQNRQMGYSREV